MNYQMPRLFSSNFTNLLMNQSILKPGRSLLKWLFRLILILSCSFGQEIFSGDIETPETSPESEIQSQETTSERPEVLRLTDQFLQTPIYTLSNPEGTVRIRLIGVVHVADLSYYQTIQNITKDLDFLFYEGVRLSGLDSKLSFFGITGDEVEQGDITNVNSLQLEIARKFHLVHQNRSLSPESNWINADVSYEELEAILKNSNLKIEELSNNLKLDNKDILVQDIEKGDDPDKNIDKNKVLSWYKRKLAESLIQSVHEICFNNDQKHIRDAIIIERNKVAVNFIKQKFNNPNPSELGILYGVAHIPHFIQILSKEYQFEIASVEWLDAWSLISN